MKIIIGIPSQDDVKAGFAFDLATMIAVSYQSIPDLQMGIVNEQGCCVFAQRNRLAAQALVTKADFLLMIDSDMRFPADTLTRLLNADKPIIACPAIRRKPPYTVNYEGMEDKTAYVSKVKRIGTGIMLIHASVFPRIELPFFAQPWIDEVGFLGSDYYFCDKCNEADIPVHCHNGLKIGHTGIKDYYGPEEDLVEAPKESGLILPRK